MQKRFHGSSNHISWVRQQWTQKQFIFFLRNSSRKMILHAVFFFSRMESNVHTHFFWETVMEHQGCLKPIFWYDLLHYFYQVCLHKLCSCFIMWLYVSLYDVYFSLCVFICGYMVCFFYVALIFYSVKHSFYYLEQTFVYVVPFCHIWIILLILVCIFFIMQFTVFIMCYIIFRMWYAFLAM